MPHTLWPRLFRSFKDARIFLVSISAVIVLFLAFISYSRYQTVNDLLIQTMLHEAESYANLIIVTRHWNASYGGVYVEKKQGMAANPYLAKTGVQADIRATDGRVLTLKNPALMTKEISALTAENGIVRFHMISLQPLNPDNNPDAFERSALQRFEAGEKKAWQIDRTSRPPLFRYVSPLPVEQSCLKCHARQGYRLGDIRGGVSVLVPASDLLDQMATNRSQRITDFLITIGLLLGVLFFLTWKLLSRLDEAQRRLKHIAVTDELTGIRNRRYIMTQLTKEYQRAVRSGDPLSLILIDIDHFKRVNDSHGHAAGDTVLKAIAKEMAQALRTYDLLGRIGGEEFLLAAPGSTLDDAIVLAERVRERIRNRTVREGGADIRVTVSAGVTSLSEQDADIDALLARADEALYLAKQQGRDRVIAV